jgi:hypothetical protein
MFAKLKGQQEEAVSVKAYQFIFMKVFLAGTSQNKLLDSAECCHTTKPTMDMLKEFFRENIIPMGLWTSGSLDLKFALFCEVCLKNACGRTIQEAYN